MAYQQSTSQPLKILVSSIQHVKTSLMNKQFFVNTPLLYV